MTKGRQGFAALKRLDPERQRDIAVSGGKAAHAQRVAHEWTSEEAREAGRKGGRRSGEIRKAQRERDDV